MNSKFAVLVVSCDAYSDLWHPFFELFFKYWNQCPYKVYLSSNYKEINLPHVTTVKSERISSWSDELKEVLNKIDEENIILILEDYYLYEKVNSNELEMALNIFLELKAVFFRLGTFPEKYSKLWPHKGLKNYRDIVEIEKGSSYRISLQTAVWNKRYLSELLVGGESPWNFEVEASKRTQNSDELFLGLKPKKGVKQVHGPIPYLCGAVTKGVWMREVLAIAKENNMDIDLSHRKIESKAQYLKRKMYIALPITLRKIYDKLF